MYFSTLFGKELYMFRQIYFPSPGVLILYLQQLVFVILVGYVDCLLVRSIPTSLADSQHNQHDKYQLL
jgi:hypothetical protein